MARRLAASTLIQRSRLPSMFRSGMVLFSAQARQNRPFGSAVQLQAHSVALAQGGCDPPDRTNALASGS